MTNYIFYPIYSIIQGITEFIPISSSGHLNILEIIVNNENSRNLLYETTAHMASLLALLLYLLKNDHFSKANIKLNFIPITLATIPAAIVGLTLLEQKVKLCYYIFHHVVFEFLHAKVGHFP